MNAEIMTIFSGVVLLLVLALVGWNLQRKRLNSEKTESKNER